VTANGIQHPVLGRQKQRSAWPFDSDSLGINSNDAECLAIRESLSGYIWRYMKTGLVVGIVMFVAGG